MPEAGAALPCDDQELSGFEDGAGEVVFCLQCFHRDTEALRDFLKRISAAHTVPPSAIGFDALHFDCRERRELIGGDTVQELDHFRAGSDRDFEVIGRFPRRCRISPEFRVQQAEFFVWYPGCIGNRVEMERSIDHDLFKLVRCHRILRKSVLVWISGNNGGGHDARDILFRFGPDQFGF